VWENTINKHTTMNSLTEWVLGGAITAFEEYGRVDLLPTDLFEQKDTVIRTTTDRVRVIYNTFDDTLLVQSSDAKNKSKPDSCHKIVFQFPPETPVSISIFSVDIYHYLKSNNYGIRVACVIRCGDRWVQHARFALADFFGSEKRITKWEEWAAQTNHKVPPSVAIQMRPPRLVRIYPPRDHHSSR